MSVEKCGDVTLKTEVVDEKKDAGRKSLSDTQILDLKTAFNMLDKDKDGRVSVEEMKDMLSNLGIIMQDGVIEALMKQANENGLISEEEFLSWMANKTSAEDDLMEDLLAAFRVFDKDGNGYITKDELKTAMELIGEAMTDSQLDDMLKATDIDNDGRINYEEFVKVLL